jgi:hypothetical protein
LLDGLRSISPTSRPAARNLRFALARPSWRPVIAQLDTTHWRHITYDERARGKVEAVGGLLLRGVRPRPRCRPRRDRGGPAAPRRLVLRCRARTATDARSRTTDQVVCAAHARCASTRTGLLERGSLPRWRPPTSTSRPPSRRPRSSRRPARLPWWRAQVATTGGTLNSCCERIWARPHEVRHGMEGWASTQLISPGRIIEHR